VLTRRRPPPAVVARERGPENAGAAADLPQRHPHACTTNTREQRTQCAGVNTFAAASSPILRPIAAAVSTEKR
jgi:hypothetical protein